MEEHSLLRNLGASTFLLSLAVVVFGASFARADSLEPLNNEAVVSSEPSMPSGAVVVRAISEMFSCKTNPKFIWCK
ncbi:hypothetical protein QP905_10810 [Corynebacterium pseudodiphtheriticum]|uniref:hypothetical protein n=1 Tax=Corynebacterium pseudodiphtheriticum TaxID=37637 RepID=UPI002491B685|nr:hypothetical protein [Corynebacterium pseudodiphtheriticum]MDK8578828.1 hypothetical protein [Corynebacterium pseudodiphtheriticum]